jgi:hypothetical protein
MLLTFNFYEIASVQGLSLYDLALRKTGELLNVKDLTGKEKFNFSCTNI